MKKLRNRFLVYVLLPAVLIIFLGATISIIIAHHVVQKQLRKLGTLALQRAADEVDLDLGRGVTALRLMALQEGTTSLSDAQRRKMLAAIAAGFPVEVCFVAFPDGKFIAGDLAFEKATGDPRQTEWYRRALASNDMILTESHMSKRYGHLINIAAIKAVDRKGNAIAVLGYAVPTAYVKKKIPRIEAMAEYKGAVFSLLSAKGQYVLHSADDTTGRNLSQYTDNLHRQMLDALKRGDATWKGFAKSADGRLWFAGLRKSRFQDVYVAVEIPAPSAVKPLARLMFAQLAVFVISVIGFSFVLIGMAKKIGKPVEMLSNAAVRLSKGDYGRRLPVISDDELGDLTRAFNTMTEGLQQRDHIRNTFGRYLTDQVVNRLLESEDALKLGGENREITILISDLRGFSSITSDMPPEKVITLLNRYLGTIVETIMDHEGIVDEIIGDGVVAFFGAPEPMDDHAARAVQCAVAMQAAMVRVNSLNKADGLPELEMGIGINTGNVVVGNIGSEKRTKYGAVGSEINMAARIESYTLGGQILVSTSTFQKTGERINVRDVLTVQVKGFHGPVTLYDVAGFDGRRIVAEDKVEQTIAEVREPIAVGLHVMRDKVVMPLHAEVQITHLSDSSAVIAYAGELEEMENIRLDFSNPEDGRMIGEAFAKVISTQLPGEGKGVFVRFTFVPSEVRGLLKKALEQVRQST